VHPEGGRVTALGFVSAAPNARLHDADRRRQIALLESSCARRGLDLVALVHDVETTRGHARPALGYAVERLSDGSTNCLIVTDLGRLCRSVAELGKVLRALERVDARLISLQPPIDTGTESGRRAAQTLCAISDWERGRAAERSRKALEAARAKGAVQPAISPELKRRIARMRGAGMTLQAIVDELNEAGVPTVRGGAKWRVSSVQSATGYKRPLRA
jgi:DNA invertase Pin-like site-specific DNA recombinase